MAVPIPFRDALYRYFSFCLDYPHMAAGFDWLLAYADLAGAEGSVLIPDLAAYGETKKGLSHRGLWDLVWTGCLFDVLDSKGKRADAKEGAAESWEEEYRLTLKPDYSDIDFLKDRAARYRAVLASRKVSAATSREAELKIAENLFNNGLFFDCHEFLETPWKAEKGEWKKPLQGLIQIAAGFHKLELSPKSRAGAAELIGKGLEKVEASKKTLGTKTAAGLADALAPALASLKNADSGDLKAPQVQFLNGPSAT